MNEEIKAKLERAKKDIENHFKDDPDKYEKYGLYPSLFWYSDPVWGDFAGWNMQPKGATVYMADTGTTHRVKATVTNQYINGKWSQPIQ